ncbi:MAG TPA: HTTM domain-containing protein [Cellvibrio sp.]|nr:HTTM domain-containing protein [Cellvibrio sp.]
MLLEQAVRVAEVILAFACVQQSLENIRGLQPEKALGFIQLVLAILLFAGVYPVYVEAGLLLVACLLLHRFQGPYNGGSDCMTLLVLLCLLLSHLAPSRAWQEIALGYLAFQLTFSYFQSGYIKIINRDWRTGQALTDVFAITAYPVSQSVRRWAQSPRLMLAMSWAVIGFELLFPLALLSQQSLLLALTIAVVFHLGNACLFGLNRFFWIWPAAYPVIIWFQQRLFVH